MRYASIALLALLTTCSSIPLLAQDQPEGPTDKKAQKTYKEAQSYLKDHNSRAALDSFKKADKQDGGRCLNCQRNIVKYGAEFSDWKAATNAAHEMVAEAKTPREIALAHYDVGMVLMDQALDKHKDDLYAEAHDEMTKALAAYPEFPEALYFDGRALGRMNQDDAAKAQFESFVKMAPPDDPNRKRALRYISEPELVRARMVPPFSITTIDGRHLSLDDFQGKVVLLDFWATWCEPCREALPHIRDITQEFQGQPLVVLSINLDKDPQKWKSFVEKNKMTWLQCWDSGFDGPLSKIFAINAIPHTFTIDADGVLQDEHIGDASIERKLKKLLARAHDLQVAQQPQPTP